MGEVVDLLDRSIYSMGQADRLLGVSAGTARRWIDGYVKRDQRYEPLVRAEPTGSGIVTWGEFVEARLISEYRRHGVSVFRMRPAIMALRKEFNTNYPLAAAQPFLDDDGRDLVLKVQQENNLSAPLRLVIRTRQVVAPSIEVRRFQQVADYGDDEKNVRRFLIAPNVAIDPEYAAGEPTIKGRRLRVDTIIEALSVGEHPEDIAEIWHITPQAVDDAVRCSNVA